MSKLLAFLLCPLFAVGQMTYGGIAAGSFQTPIPAASGSSFQGFGINATGGSNVVHVTNLNASGAGSMLACATVSGNHCVFDVSGTINQTATLLVASNVFIDGFTSPTGITITGGDAQSGGACMYIRDVSNVIVQGLRFRNCNNSDDKSIEVYGQNVAIHDIVIDHVELSAAADEVLGLVNVHDITVSWSILHNTTGASGCLLFKYGSYRGSIHHNLFSGCSSSASDSRIPLIHPGDDCCLTGTVTDPGLTADVQWNVAGNFTPYGFIADDDQVTRNYGNHVGNYYDMASDPDHLHNVIGINANSHTQWYMAGNAVNGNMLVNQPPFTYDTKLQGTGTVPNSFTMTSANVMTCGTFTGCQPATPFATPAITGPCVYDNATRITEWTNVINNTGVVSHYADDATTTSYRNAVTKPTLTILGNSWNTQTGSC